MTWTPIKFGKHIGYTLLQIMLSDPDYFYCAIKNREFERKEIIENEAKKLFYHEPVASKFQTINPADLVT